MSRQSSLLNFCRPVNPRTETQDKDETIEEERSKNRELEGRSEDESVEETRSDVETAALAGTNRRQKKDRKLSLSWNTKYGSWLRFDADQDLMFCKLCEIAVKKVSGSEEQTISGPKPSRNPRIAVTTKRQWQLKHRVSRFYPQSLLLLRFEEIR